jgi:hypothetical protein
MDSDGWFGVKRNTYGVRITKSSSQPSYNERMGVKQVEPEAVTLLKGLFGGYLGVCRSTLANGKPIYVWETSNRSAAKAITAMLPYLRIKRRQALNCLALRALTEESKKAKVAFGRGHVGAACRPKKLTNKMEKLHRRAKALNRQGVAAERRV